MGTDSQTDVDYRTARNSRTAAVTPQHAVLIVDDEPAPRELFGRWLKRAGHTVETASSAGKALEIQSELRAPVVVCDIRMPGYDGLWLAEQLRDQHPETAIIMVTGAPDVGTAVTSLRQGVADYLSKPCSADRLRQSVQRGYEWHQAVVDLRRGRTVASVGDRTVALPSGAIPDAINVDSAAALDGLLAMLAARDSSAHAHAHRVAALAADLARALHAGDAMQSTIERAALLHDIGKTALPEAILGKRGSLSVEELNMVRRHPQIGHEMVSGLWPYLAGTAEIVRATQERYDGTGFPHGISGEAIPLGARIIAVADVFDTVTTPRVFREARSEQHAMSEIVAGAGTQFDPAVVEMFEMGMAVVVH